MHPTPSTTASPVPRRPPFLSPPPVRADGPSPSKRRKFGVSGPESSASFASESSSTAAVNPQLDAERRAASMRVLNVWSALADKYARRLDEDDIVDLRTGGLIRDRGVLSGTAGTWDIGCFADAAADGNTDPEGDEDQSDDELGGWGSWSELDHLKPVHVPPVQELDPEDAEDLRDFLAAEAVRRAEQGEDDDEDSVDEYPDSDGDDSDGAKDVGVGVYDIDPEGSIVEVDAGSALALSDEESPDELDGYDETVGEGAMLWKVGSEMSSEPLGRTEHRTKTPALQLSPLRRPQTPAQLRTPPLSRSSAMPPPMLIHKPPLDLPRPEPHHADARSSPKGKGEGKATDNVSITPTKNLIPEVLISSRRRASTVRPQSSEQDESTPLKRRKRISSVPRIPNKHPMISRGATRRASSSSPSKSGSSHHPPSIDVDELLPSEPSAPSPPRKPVKRKHVHLEKEDEQDVGNVPTSPEDEKVHLPHRTPSRSRRRSIAPQQQQLTHDSTPHHAHAPPAMPDFWSPYSRHASVAPPFPGPYTPNHAHEPSVPPQLDAHVLLAQAMQSLSYLVYSSPSGSHQSWQHPAGYYPPPPATSPVHSSPLHHRHPTPMHPPPAPHSPYPFQPTHPHPHPPWPHQPYQHPYTPPRHPHPPPTSSALSFAPGPPSSPESSPLSGRGKGKGKRVSFPDEKDDDEHDDDERGRSWDDFFDPLESPRTKSAPPRRSSGPGSSVGSGKPRTHSAASSGSGSRPPPEPARVKSKSRK